MKRTQNTKPVPWPAFYRLPLNPITNVGIPRWDLYNYDGIQILLFLQRPVNCNIKTAKNKDSSIPDISNGQVVLFGGIYWRNGESLHLYKYSLKVFLVPRLSLPPEAERRKDPENQPRPQGAFPWLWRWGAPSQSQGKAPWYGPPL